MNTEVANYDFHGSTVRIHVDGDTVEYCARDIATALGYTNTSKAISDHCRGVTNRYPIVDSLGRTQEATFVSEGDVYRLIVSSQLPAAVEFEHWLFDEVVPQIRPGYLKPKTGVRPDGKIAGQYAHFTPKGMGWFVQRYIYGTAQGTLAGTGMEV